MTKRNIYQQFASLVFGVCIMTAFTGCSKGEMGNGAGGRRNEAQPIEELTIEGNYEAKFTALNSSVSGMTSAKAKIHVIADQISVSLDAKDSPALSIHSQFIYTASECPTEVHDSNNDGFIDSVEASKVLGAILIPLDANLNSQLEGIETFPLADSLGSYKYYQEGVLSKLLADLQSLDPELNDELGKLPVGKDLKLDGKVIVIQGIPEEVYLPGSIRAPSYASERMALPIACGKITRVLLDESATHEEEETI